jgi:O-antigen/teichoic acid export membrane protein
MTSLRNSVNRLSKNLILNVAGQGIVLILSLIAVKFIFKQLGDDVFGILYFNITLTTVVTAVLELGVLATTTREVSLHSDSEPLYITRLVRTASLLYWSISLLLVFAIIATAPFLVEHWINLRTIDSGTAAIVIRILSISTMVVLPRALYTSLFRGRQRMAINNIIDITATATQQVGILVLLKLGAGVYAVAGWMSASMVLSIIAYLIVAGHIFGPKALLPGFDTAVVRRNVSYTRLMLANSVLSLVHGQADKVVLSKLLSVGEFGFYGFASATVGRATFVAAAIGQASFPSFATLFAAGDRSALLRQFRQLQDLVCFMTAPIFAAVCFAALPVYGYLFSTSVATRLLVPTTLLAFGFYMNSALNQPFMLSFAVGKPRVIVTWNVVALFVVLPVTVLLIVSYGMTGAALSWIFYNLFAFVFIVPAICKDNLQISVWSWYQHVVKSGVLAVAAYGAGWRLIASAGSYSISALFIAYAAGSIAFAVGAYILIGRDLRDTIWRLPRALLLSKSGTP